MASLTNTKIKNTYVSLLKVADNGQLDAALQDITDGAGNVTGVQLNTGGDLAASGTVSFGSLKDTGENITISKFVDAADGIGSNNNDTTIPTSAAVKLYVDTNITAQDLDFTTDSGTGAVDLDSQTFSILGTANEIETSGTGQTVTIGLPSSITVDVTGNLTGNVSGNVTGNVTGDLTGNVTATSVLANGVTATTQTIGDNSTKVATTAYVDSVVTAEDLDIAGDSGTGAVDLDSQTLTIAGTANEIETLASGQTITIGLPSTITANVTGNVSGNLTGTVLTAAQTNITSVGTLSSLAVSGNLAVDTNTLFVDATNNAVGVGTTSSLGGQPFFVVNPTTAESVMGIQSSSASGYSAIDLYNSSGSAKGAFGYGNASVSASAVQDSVYMYSTTDLRFLSGGLTERMRIDSSGNVGIGTSSPNSNANRNTLTLQGSWGGQVDINVGATNHAQFGTDNFNSGLSCRIQSIDGIVFYGTGGSERMRIDSSGRVGIGATPADWAAGAGGGSLRIGSNAHIQDDGNSSYYAHNLYYNAGWKFLDSNAHNGNYILMGDDGTMQFANTSNTGTSGQAATVVERMRINSSGRVGIGTSSPNTDLEILSADGGKIRLTNTQGLWVAGDIISENQTYITDGSGIGARIVTNIKSISDSTGVTPSGAIVFETSGNNANVTETVRFPSTGGITFNGDTAAANALDDYEEGTWTPEVTASTAPTGVTYNYQGGRYTKVGRMVSVQFGLQLSSVGTGGSGDVSITGLPFVSLNVGSYQEPSTRIFATGWTTTSYASSVYAFVNNSTTIMSFRIGQNVDSSPPYSDLQNTTSLIGHLIYYV
jgi:trimeric autotransporter adhesin